MVKKPGLRIKRVPYENSVRRCASDRSHQSHNPRDSPHSKVLKGSNQHASSFDIVAAPLQLVFRGSATFPSSGCHLVSLVMYVMFMRRLNLAAPPLIQPLSSKSKSWMSHCLRVLISSPAPGFGFLK